MKLNFSLKIFLFLYFVLLVTAIALPLIIQNQHLLLVANYILLLFLFSFGIFVLIFNQANFVDVQKKERSAARQTTAFTGELIETYKHMGKVNRQLEMIKGLVNSSSITEADLSQVGLRQALNNILSSAATSIKADWGLMRFIDQKDHRTLTEFRYRLEKDRLVNISNKALVDYMRAKKWNSRYFFVIPDEREKNFATFLIFPKTKDVLEADDSFLKAFCNQAQLIFMAFHDKLIKTNYHARTTRSRNNQKPAQSANQG